ncbi:MAG TPA: DUF447 family protein [Gemmatales bacterium]|nr:DUF447 family protein [Gemmatales bacterium]
MPRESLVIEGIVTTIGSDGQVNIAPMGPKVDRQFRRMTLRPFKASQTYKNLVHHPEGVFHVVDDVLFLAQAAVGQIEPVPIMIMSDHVNGYILRDACRFFAFQVDRLDDSQDRAEIDVSIIRDGRMRDHFGFNRAMFAVVEASILATRVHMLPRTQIDDELNKLSPLIEKTGGLREQEAFAFLKNYIAQQPDRPKS